jgi:hypothetical protein
MHSNSAFFVMDISFPLMVVTFFVSPMYWTFILHHPFRGPASRDAAAHRER